MNQRPSNRPSSGPHSSMSPGVPVASAPPEIDALRLLHELQVHQIELAQQNEELVTARADLQASAQRYFDLYESAPVGLVSLDGAGIVSDANRVARDLMADDDLVGKRLLDCFAGAKRGELDRVLSTSPAELAIHQVEISVSAPVSGARVLRVEIHSRPAGESGVLLALSDITEQRRSEAELARTREILELSNRVARIGYWQVDLDTGKSTWSAVAREVCGLAPSSTLEPPGRFLDFCKDLQARERLRAAKDAAVQYGTAFDQELQITTGAGDDRWIRITGKVDTSGQFARRLYGTVQDIDAHMQAGIARLAQVEAEMANRSKNAFLARMSHDLRTPLNAVLGFSELLELDPAAMALPRVAAQVHHIHEAGQHLLAMVDEVLDLTRIESGDLQIAMAPVELASLLDDCMTLVAPLATARQVTLRASQTAPGQRVLGDRTRLRQVLMNLLSNAIKYNREGGSVDIDLHGSEGGFVVAVRDTGPGLSPDQIGHLFEPFNRLGAERRGIEGTGLGLVITKQLVEAMDGTIEVQSDPGAGSVFSLHLQRATPVEGTNRTSIDRPIDANAQLLGDHPFVVLLVEDNPVNVALIRAALAHRPQVRVDVAYDGQAGLEMTRALRPDLVLLDIGLPIMDGLTVLAHLRADPELARIPCVAVSANAMDADIRVALDAGFADYLVKPVALSSLLQLLDSAMASSTAARQRSGQAGASSGNSRVSGP